MVLLFIHVAWSTNCSIIGTSADLQSLVDIQILVDIQKLADLQIIADLHSLVDLQSQEVKRNPTYLLRETKYGETSPCLQCDVTMVR